MEKILIALQTELLTKINAKCTMQFVEVVANLMPREKAHVVRFKIFHYSCEFLYRYNSKLYSNVKFGLIQIYAKKLGVNNQLYLRSLINPMDPSSGPFGQISVKHPTANPTAKSSNETPRKVIFVVI